MADPEQILTLDCPAKINLGLCITGRREDGFHELISPVAKVAFGDLLQLQWIEDGSPGNDSVCYVQPENPALRMADAVVESKQDTVSQAVELFRKATGLTEGTIRIRVEKRIPPGAGLGGGSSDGAAALMALQAVLGERVSGVDLVDLSASIGSDCPLFMVDGPVIMEGRGERISQLDTTLRDRLKGHPVILFKPPYGIQTAEAYKRLAARACYSGQIRAQDLLDEWREGGTLLPREGNDFERLCSFWMPDLAVILARLRRHHGLEARLSGSGSACFLLTDAPDPAMRILEQEMQRAWGHSYWVEQSVLK